MPILVAKNSRSFSMAHDKLWGKQIRGGLDFGNKACASFQNGQDPGIVILGPDFEVMHVDGGAHKGSYFYPGKGPVNLVALKRGLAKVGSKGLLGGLSVPDNAKSVADLIKSAQLANAANALKRLSSSGATGEFRKVLEGRLEALRLKKIQEFEAMLKAGDKWGAYKVGSSYVRQFTSGPDFQKMRSAVGKLKSDKDVSKELRAEQDFLRTLGMLYGPRANAAAIQHKDHYLKQISTRHKDTQYGKIAAGMCGQ